MTIFILVQLNSPLGANVGPIINLTTDVGTPNPNVASTTQLLTGILVEVDILATQITLTSEGVCQTDLILSIPTFPAACRCYTVANTETIDGVVPYKIDYYDCDKAYQSLLVPKGTSVNLCAEEGTIVPNFTNTITDNGHCIAGCTTTTTTTANPCTCILIESLELTPYEYTDCNGIVQSGTVSVFSPINVCGDFNSTVPHLGTSYTDNGPCTLVDSEYQCPPL
jgi:hypothetical protein